MENITFNYDQMKLLWNGTVRELANEAGLSTRTLYDLEDPNHNWRRSTIVKLASVLKVSPAELLNLESRTN